MHVASKFLQQSTPLPRSNRLRPMLTVNGEALKAKPAKSRKTLTLLPQVVKSLQRAVEDFGRAEPSGEAPGQRQKGVCVLQGEYAEVDLSKVRLQVAT